MYNNHLHALTIKKLNLLQFSCSLYQACRSRYHWDSEAVAVAVVRLGWLQLSIVSLGSVVNYKAGRHKEQIILKLSTII